jgi:hypothetical protein
LLVELKFLSGHVEMVVDHLDEVSFEVVDVGQSDSADLSDVFVGIVGVVEHLGCQEYRGQNEPKRT